MKTALITGITGQDGSYLSELLLSKGYKVYGMIRRNSSPNTNRLKNVEGNNNLFLEFGDLSDSSSIDRIMDIAKPDEVYNLGAQSHVAVSFDIPEYTADITGVGTLRLLESIRRSNKEVKFYQASSSELYGRVLETPQTESTQFNPRSPYGVAKLYSFYITKNYREAYDIHASNGILFNHCGERRGENFVTRKITKAVANIKVGNQDCLYLGNIGAKRDWSHAKDMVNAMYLMLQQKTPDDYVVASGETHTVKEFCELAFKRVSINISWNGEGLNEVGLNDHGRVLVRIDPQFFRPAEVDLLLGDPTKAKNTLGWKPEIDFEELVYLMVDHDLKSLNF